MAIDTAEIERVSSLVGDLARRDVSGLSRDDLLEVYDAVARLGRLAGTLQSRFAGEIARRSTPDHVGGGLARQQGFGNAGQMVSSVTGGSKAGAMRSIEAGLALTPVVAPVGPGEGSAPAGMSADGVGPMSRSPRYPAVAAASLAGDLSVDAAGLITAGLETLTDRMDADRLHDLERRLVAKAVTLAAHEVRRLVASAVARADLAGHEERERRQHAERYVAFKEDHTGMVTLSGRLDAVTAAPIRTVIEQVVTQRFRARRDQDPMEADQRTVGQMRADALFEMCRHALGCTGTDSSGVRTTVVVRMDKADLETGRGLGRIDGTAQPVSVGELRRLAGDAGIVPQVLGGDGEVLDQGRKVRLFTRAQRIALVERDGGCAKCHAPPEHCEAHHIRWWDRGGRTDLANGVMLCTRCHHDIHRQGWDIRVEAGRVSFIPPPHIDPERRPRPGGVAALEIAASDSANPGHHPDHETHTPGENSAHDRAAREDSAHGQAARENSGHARPVESWRGALRWPAATSRRSPSTPPRG